MDSILFYGDRGDASRRQVRSAAAQHSHRIGPRKPKSSKRPRGEAQATTTNKRPLKAANNSNPIIALGPADIESRNAAKNRNKDNNSQSTTPPNSNDASTAGSMSTTSTSTGVNATVLPNSRAPAFLPDKDLGRQQPMQLKWKEVQGVPPPTGPGPLSGRREERSDSNGDRLGRQTNGQPNAPAGDPRSDWRYGRSEKLGSEPRRQPDIPRPGQRTEPTIESWPDWRFQPGREAERNVPLSPPLIIARIPTAAKSPGNHSRQSSATSSISPSTRLPQYSWTEYPRYGTSSSKPAPSLYALADAAVGEQERYGDRPLSQHTSPFQRPSSYTALGEHGAYDERPFPRRASPSLGPVGYTATGEQVNSGSRPLSQHAPAPQPAVSPTMGHGTFREMPGPMPIPRAPLPHRPPAYGAPPEPQMLDLPPIRAPATTARDSVSHPPLPNSGFRQDLPADPNEPGHAPPLSFGVFIRNPARGQEYLGGTTPPRRQSSGSDGYIKREGESDR